jgi:hypothetical protein
MVSTGWFRRNFGLGVLLPGTLCSVLAWMVLEWRLPWFVAPVHSLALYMFSSIAYAFSYTRSFVTGFVSVPRWFLLPLILYVVISLFRGVRRLLKTLAAPLEPHWTDYVQDNFYGILWKWEYYRDGNGIRYLQALCPHCMRGLAVNISYQQLYEWSCREHGTLYNGENNIGQMEFVVRDEIRRNLDTGAWKPIVRSYAEPPQT